MVEVGMGVTEAPEAIRVLHAQYPYRMVAHRIPRKDMDAYPAHPDTPLYELVVEAYYLQDGWMPVTTYGGLHGAGDFDKHRDEIEQVVGELIEERGAEPRYEWSPYDCF